MQCSAEREGGREGGVKQECVDAISMAWIAAAHIMTAAAAAAAAATQYNLGAQLCSSN